MKLDKEQRSPLRDICGGLEKGNLHKIFRIYRVCFVLLHFIIFFSFLRILIIWCLCFKKYFIKF